MFVLFVCVLILCCLYLMLWLLCFLYWCLNVLCFWLWVLDCCGCFQFDVVLICCLSVWSFGVFKFFDVICFGRLVGCLWFGWFCWVFAICCFLPEAVFVFCWSVVLVYFVGGVLVYVLWVGGCFDWLGWFWYFGLGIVLCFRWVV